MITLKTTLAGLSLAGSIFGLACSAVAQSHSDRTGARERPAIHDCSVRARKEFPHENEEETLNYFAYRSCMGEHGFLNE